ncbi:hypothetical protein CLG96_08990 [Sphingomonas oleivorans]|uniref:DUF418 domain-containing protein n=1 Tax=Sphingomonas oleivorans TaxID=1735121 RepID=A0A2T5FYE2_9SPHN|nr:DUF418 domain-containing protein [Sphingomonas oleivorans]PTQ11558.1 hypothetical protein CLG96_08990 [Sphingomonas oleivorans]
MTFTDLPGAGERHHTLDGLRGVAVMGILLMNIVAFAMPFAAYDNPAAYGSTRPADIAVWAINFVLTDGKMRALFSLLFGASMLLVIQRAEAAGRNAAKVHYSRMIWLLVFGLIHLYLIWFGDILVHYALIGMIAFLFRDKDAASLRRWGIGLLLFQLLLMVQSFGEVAAISHAAHLPGADAAAVATWENLREDIGVPSPADIAEDLALHRDGYIGILIDRLTDDYGTPIDQLEFSGFETLGLMLLGMAGLKSGFLTGRLDRARYRRTAILGYALGLPPMILLAWLSIRSGFDDLLTYGAVNVAAMPFRWILLAAHTSLIILWLTRGSSPLRTRVIAVGRAAFTNYLGTSIVMTTLFYGYGLGLYGHVARAWLYPIVFVAWLGMLLWSRPWLDRFAYGPLEWLWRSLARRAPQPMRRKAPSAIAS